MLQCGGGAEMHQVSGGADLDVGVLWLPHHVGTHPPQQLLHRGGEPKRRNRTPATRSRDAFHSAVAQALPT